MNKARSLFREYGDYAQRHGPDLVNRVANLVQANILARVEVVERRLAVHCPID